MSRHFGSRRSTAGTAALALAVAALAAATSLPAHAQFQIEGTIAQVLLPPDPAAGPYGALTMSNSAGDTQLFLAADTQIEVAGLAGTLADLHVGDTAEVDYVDGTDDAGAAVFTAVRIEVARSPQQLFGLVTQVGTNLTDATVVDLTIDPPTGEPVTLQVDASAVVKVGDRRVDLASLTAEQLSALRGWYAQATYVEGPDGNNPTSQVHFQKARRLPFRGVVHEATEGSLTVAVSEGEYLTLEWRTSTNRRETTQARLNGQRAANFTACTPGDLCHGIFVMMLDDDPAAKSGHNVALMVTAKWPRPVPYSGTLALGAGASEPVSTARRGRAGTIGGPTDVQGSFELVLRDGTTRVYPIMVYSQTQIRINGKPASFADLKDGQKVHVLCIPRADGYHCLRLQAQKMPASSGTDE